jgi:hypothetical protein
MYKDGGKFIRHSNRNISYTGTINDPAGKFQEFAPPPSTGQVGSMDLLLQWGQRRKVHHNTGRGRDVVPDFEKHKDNKTGIFRDLLKKKVLDVTVAGVRLAVDDAKGPVQGRAYLPPGLKFSLCRTLFSRQFQVVSPERDRPGCRVW